MSQGFTRLQPLDTDVTLAGNSDYIAPSQSAVKGALANKLNINPTELIITPLVDGADILRVNNSTGSSVFSVDTTYKTRIFGSLALTAVVSNSLGSPTYNNFNLQEVSVLRLSPSSNTVITGLANGYAGRFVTIINLGAGLVTLSKEDAGSTDINRFSISTNVVLGTGESVVLYYDTAGSYRWRIVSSPTLVGTAQYQIPVSGASPYKPSWTTISSTALAWLASPTASNLETAVVDNTGSGNLVFATSPTLVTPTLGNATATTINKVAITTPATGSTLTIQDGFTLTVTGNASISGTNSGDNAANSSSTYIGTTAVALNRASGALTLAGITLTTPNLGTPSTLVGTNISGTGASFTAGKATTLATARTIAGVSFDGSANIAIPSTGLSDFTDTTSWTPAISGTTTAGAGTYTSRLGYYWKIGKLVFVQIELVWTAHTGTGNMRITNFPFAFANSGINATFPISWSNLTLLAAGNKVLVNGTAAQTYAAVIEIGSGATGALPMDTAGTLVVTGCYLTD